MTVHEKQVKKINSLKTIMFNQIIVISAHDYHSYFCSKHFNAPPDLTNHNILYGVS